MPTRTEQGALEETVRAILASARTEIESKGILGLRVADVAHGAHSSITQIYRYFGNRDGLLAAVLGDIYEEYLDKGFETVMERLSTHDRLTIDDIVDALPSPTDGRYVQNQEVRLQILAAAVTNEALSARLQSITQSQLAEWSEGLDLIEGKLASGAKIDRRVFLIMLSMQTGYYRTLMGEHGFSEDEYRAFLRDKLRA